MNYSIAIDLTMIDYPVFGSHASTYRSGRIACDVCCGVLVLLSTFQFCSGSSMRHVISIKLCEVIGKL